MALKKTPEMDTSRRIQLYNLLSDPKLAWSIEEIKKKVNLNSEDGEKLLRRELRSLKKKEFIILKEVDNELYARGTDKLVKEWKRE